MSYTTMYVINAAGQAEHLREFQNSHGFAPAIWTPICAKYLGSQSIWLTDNGSKLLWPLYKDQRLPLHWRVALASTFDRAVIKSDSAKLVTPCLREFYADTDDTYPRRVSHLQEIADELWKLPAGQHWRVFPRHQYYVQPVGNNGGRRRCALQFPNGHQPL